ncbi:hypothetical protein CASFOL_042464 [Castilleja foliolosa]|uniref:IBB domain-containing protein n=1 Tax=Castilleja foliolosa TaxID=1961234 RepID=A0ABD3BAK2_9LAMI
MSLRPGTKADVRRSRYKVAVDADEGRRRREDNMVEIRKNKREESLLKKRREGLQQQPQFTSSVQSSDLKKRWIEGDAVDLPFSGSSFDAATIGYGLRNVLPASVSTTSTPAASSPVDSQSANLRRHLEDEAFKI